SAEAFEDGGHALTTTDAQGLQTEGLVVELESVDQGAGDAGTGAAERVTEGDRAAVDVQLLLDVDPQPVGGGQYLRGEGLVEFDQVDVTDGHVGAGQGLLGGLHRAQAHDLRAQSGQAGGHDAGQRRDAEFGSLGVAHDDQCRSAVVEGAGVSGGDGAVGAEHRFQLGDLFVGGATTDTVVGADHGAVGQGHRGDLTFPEAVVQGLFGAVL